MTGYSASRVSPENYTRKVNMKWEEGKEVLIGGNEKFSDLEFPADVTFIHTVERPNGDHCIVCGTATTLYRWSGIVWWVIGTGFDPNANRWRAVNKNGYTIFNNGSDLPCYYRVEFEREPTAYEFSEGVASVIDQIVNFGGTPQGVVPLYELREQGIAYCQGMEIFNETLMFSNVTELTDEFRATWMNEAADPYSRIQDEHPEYLTTTDWRVIQSDYDPTRWKLGVKATVLASAPNQITAEFPLRSIAIGDTINFRETEEDGDAVEVFVTEATVTAISENRKTYTFTPAADEDPITTDSTGFLTRTTWAQEVAGYTDARSDGSAINQIVRVSDRLIAIRSTGFSFAYADGSTIKWEKKTYQGPYNVHYKNLWTVINDEILAYRSRDLWFGLSMVSKKPSPLNKLNMVRKLYNFSSYAPKDIFIFNHETSSQAWICTPDRTLVFDYLEDKVFEVDEAYTAGANTYEADSSDRFLMLGKNRWVLRAERNKAGDYIYTRQGNPYQGILEWGLWGEERREFVASSFIPILSSQSADQPMQYSLFKLNFPNDTRTLFHVKTLTESDAIMGVHLKSPYVQEQVIFPSGPAEFQGRTVHYREVKANITRHGTP